MLTIDIYNYPTYILENVAFNKTVMMSSYGLSSHVFGGYLSVDGNMNPRYEQGHCAYAASKSDGQTYLSVNLGKRHLLNQIVIIPGINQTG